MSAVPKFHHVAICVDDINEAMNWYADNFGAKTIYQDETWALIGTGEVQLALVLPDQHPPHIAFEFEDAEKYGPLTVHRDGTASVYVEDPYGNTLELLKNSELPKAYRDLLE